MAADPSVSPADTPDYEAIRLRAQAQLSHFAVGGGITGLPSCDRCGKPTNRWDEPCNYLPTAAALLAEDALALLAVGERDKAEAAEWKAEATRYKAQRSDAYAHRSRDGRRIAQLTEALAFYADEDNYFETYPDETQVPMQCPALADEGKRARGVLAGEEDANG